MGIKYVEVPLWKGLNEDKTRKLIVTEFGGKIILTVKGENDLTIEFYKNDLDRAWNAIKKM